MADAHIFFNKIIVIGETWCFACDPKTKRQISEWVDETFPRPQKLKFQTSCITNMLVNFFDSQGVVHKEFVPEGKRANPEFYKGVTDRLLKRNQRFRPAEFCSRDFCQFLTPQECYNLLSSPFSTFISARLFYVPQVEN